MYPPCAGTGDRLGRRSGDASIGDEAKGRGFKTRTCGFMKEADARMGAHAASHTASATSVAPQFRLAEGDMDQLEVEKEKMIEKNALDMSQVNFVDQLD